MSKYTTDRITPKNHSIWIIFSIKGGIRWFNEKTEAKQFISDWILLGGRKDYYSEPIKYTKDF